MDKGIHILGLGNLGKYVAFALRGGHRTDKVPHLPPVTLFFHKFYLLKHWGNAQRSIFYIPENDALPPEARKYGKATGFRVELLGDALTRLQPGEVEHHPDVAIGDDSPIKHLIVATKTVATTAAITPIKHRLGKDSHILFLQNGMGVTDEVSEKLFPRPGDRPTYWAGICSAGICSKLSFSFVHAGTGPLSIGVVGAHSQSPHLPPPAMDGNPMVAQLLDAGLLQTVLLPPERIVLAQLMKLVVNSMINPLTAIYNCRNGQLVELAQKSYMFPLLLQEAGAIVRAMLPNSDQLFHEEFSDQALDDLVRNVAQKTANNTSSMLQTFGEERRPKSTTSTATLSPRGRDWVYPPRITRPSVGGLNGLESEARQAAQAALEPTDDSQRTGGP